MTRERKTVTVVIWDEPGPPPQFVLDLSEVEMREVIYGWDIGRHDRSAVAIRQGGELVEAYEISVVGVKLGPTELVANLQIKRKPPRDRSTLPSAQAKRGRSWK